MRRPDISERIVERLRSEGWLIVPADCVAPALRRRALKPTAEMAVELLDDEAQRKIDALRRAAAAAFKVTEEALVGESRVPRIVEARQAGMFFAVERLKWPLRLAAMAFGRLDHSTASHAVARIRELPEDGKNAVAKRLSEVAAIYGREIEPVLR